MKMYLIDPFMDSIKNTFNKMAGIDISNEGNFYIGNGEISSLGIASIISFSGKMYGNFLLDMENYLALETAKKITGSTCNFETEYEVLTVIHKLNNTIVTDAITKLNNCYSLELKSALPIVFTGKDTLISVPRFEPVCVDCVTPFGKMKVYIAFEEV